MTFLHLSDLHLGRRQNGFDRLPDQREILGDILEICRERRPDAVLISGDVYDAAVPPREAVTLFDDFICSAADTGANLLIIAGNHDGAERLSFGGRLMSRAGVYIAGGTGDMPAETVVLSDEYGPVRFVMLPFLRLADLRKALGEGAPDDPAEAFAALLDSLDPFDGRQVILSHQFYLPSSGELRRCDSEAPSVGGLEALPASLLGRFRYAALGHIHTPQPVGGAEIRYCGSPLKYSSSEAAHEKSVPLITMDGSGDIKTELLPLVPKRDVRVIRGGFDALISAAAAADAAEREHYYYVTLTGGDEPDDAMTRLRYYYPNIMRLNVEKESENFSGDAEFDEDTETGSVSSLFAEFFERQNGRAPDEEEMRVIGDIAAEIGEEARE